MPTARTYTVLTYDEVEKLIRDSYGIDYEIAAAEEANLDDNLTFRLDGILDKFDEGDLERIIRGEWIPYRTRLILNDLVRRAVLQTGYVMIEV